MSRERVAPVGFVLATLLLATFLPAAFADAQTIELTSRTPGEPGATIESEAASLVGPIVQNGADPEKNSLRNSHIQDAARRIVQGYTTKGVLQYSFGPDGFQHRSPIINLSTGHADSIEIQRHGDLYVSLGPGMGRLSETPATSPWFNPFVRFVFLGRRTLSPNERPDTTRSGTLRMEERNVRYQVEWRPKGDQTEIVAHAIRPVGAPVLVGRALVAPDRSQGTLTRMLGKDRVIAEESFRRVGPAPVLPTSFVIPLGRSIIDERVRDDGRPASYPWPGHLPTPAEIAARPQDATVPPLVVAGVAGIGVLLVGAGTARMRRSRRPLKPAITA